jgi:hypothetical protein
MGRRNLFTQGGIRGQIIPMHICHRDMALNLLMSKLLLGY